MIGRLSGRLIDLSPSRATIDAGGVGYDVAISLQTFYALSSGLGETVTVAVHTHAREDVLALYGFAETDEREMFRLLIGISGIGPRVALAILSGVSAGELRRVVAGEDRARLQRIPGVGKRTAERVILELGDRMRREARGAGASEARRAGPGTDGGTVRGDAVSALVHLGYAEDTARKAVDAELEAADEGVTLEDALRGALRRLVR